MTSPSGGEYVCKSGPLDGETETTFCEKLGMACGNPHNPIPKVPQFSTTSDATASSLDWLTQQSGGSTNGSNSNNNPFDPVFFGDYRDPTNDLGNGIGMGFFDDEFATVNFDDIQTESHAKKDPLALCDALNADDDDDDDEDEVMPAEDRKKMLSCNKIWWGFPTLVLMIRVLTACQGQDQLTPAICQRRARYGRALLRAAQQGKVLRGGCRGGRKRRAGGAREGGNVAQGLCLKATCPSLLVS